MKLCQQEPCFCACGGTERRPRVGGISTPSAFAGRHGIAIATLPKCAPLAMWANAALASLNGNTLSTTGFMRLTAIASAIACRSSTEPLRRADRLVQRADAADFDDEIDAMAGHLPRELAPFRCGLVVDGDVGAELLELFDLGLARRGRDHARAAHFCELQCEDRNAAGALGQHRLPRPDVAEFYHRAPRRQPGTGERSRLGIAEMIRRA